MSNTILLKKNSTPGNQPTTAQMDVAELAMNTFEGRLFARGFDNADFIQPIALAPGRRVAQMFDDFISNNTSSGTIGQAGWASAVSGSGSGISYQNSFNDCCGVIQLAKGTNAAGYAVIHQGVTSLVCGNGSVFVSAHVRIPTTSISSAQFAAIIGTGNVTNNGTDTNGIQIIYDSNISGNWIFKSISGGAASQVFSSVPVQINTWVNVRYHVLPDGSRVDFYIDEVLAGSISTNIPVSTGRVSAPMCKIIGRAGSSNQTLQIDYYGFERMFIASR